MLALVLWLTAEAAVDTAPLAEAFESGDRASVSLPDTPFLLASP